MPSDCPVSAQAQALADETVTCIETKAIPKLVSGVMMAKKLRDEVQAEKGALSDQSLRLQQVTAHFFDLSRPEHAEDVMAQLIQQEKDGLEEVQQEKERVCSLKKSKEQESNRLRGQLDGLTAENKQLDLKKKQQWQDKRRVVGHIMQTKFRLNKENRCVSLLCSAMPASQQRVENAIEVPDKENAHHSEFKNSFWDKVSRIYNLP